MLKILVDATALRAKPSGIGLYIYHLIDELYKLQEQENFELNIFYQPSVKNWIKGNFSAYQLLQKYSNLNCLPIPVSISHLLATHAKTICSYFDRYLDLPNLIHGTDHVVYPLPHALKVMNIYDLTFIKYPQFVNSRVKTYSQRVKECLKWTDLILTISESTKQDIIEDLGVKPEKIYVTYLASRYTKLPQISLSIEYLKPYILFVSTIEPRKNLTNLIAAFNHLKQKHKIEHKLVLIGQKGWRYESIFAAINNSPYQQDIHHLDYLSDDEVAAFYSQADVFAYPSIYEGFGLPVLEAMTLNTPVVTSNTSSLPEVVGDAAILIDPQDPLQIAEAILQVISNTHLRQSLIEKGKKRVKLFSWEKTAQETLKAYRTIL
ncbi:glycosyltransferase family 1 protein [Chroococcus sp. FPU101]|uniref:glycosyltransferase family 4 protein n=1 Tax=Chroococcus sp. FPU101 TaxID=1974212 RepID=UPI001A8E78B9|nr:glycosyltransferase family 1 protein [Chroococcus sp. FPU101]GFE71284.1 glycosyl transferase group 1 [Chroococcus sp. FPU101]